MTHDAGHACCAEYGIMKRRIEQLEKALEPFAKGADEIPEHWPDTRALLIGEEHPDNPKNWNLLLSFVKDYREARAVLKDKSR